MAVLDPRDDSVVIRVVYDGAPMAGKTTSVGALGQCLGHDVVSPEELAGRTLYFDWLEYTGGWFEGHQIRCQIVSVPGQTTLAPRRRRLLESADVVVFVCSSSAAGVATDLEYLRALQSILWARDGLPAGIVVQANKRDLPGAVPVAELQAQFEQLGLRAAVVESIAASGSGVREAFVLAVRLALDRVRELMSAGKLPTLAPSVDSAADLLRELQRSESRDAVATPESSSAARHSSPSASSPSASSPSASLGAAALCEAIEDAEHGHLGAPVGATTLGPTPPDARVASGLLWPPVDGRLMLHEITTTPPRLEQLAQGAWGGVAGRWRCYTSGESEFATLEQGRNALVTWASAHARCQDILSKDRCIALVAETSGGFRLWQVLKIQRTLHQYFTTTLQQPAETLAAALLTVVRTFLRMATALAAIPYQLPPSMDCIALTDGRLCYAGLMPEPKVLQPAHNWTASEAGERLLEELQVHRTTLHERRIEVLAALAQQVRSAAAISHGEWALLQRIVLHDDGGSTDSQRRTA